MASSLTVLVPLPAPVWLCGSSSPQSFEFHVFVDDLQGALKEAGGFGEEAPTPTLTPIPGRRWSEDSTEAEAEAEGDGGTSDEPTVDESLVPAGGCGGGPLEGPGNLDGQQPRAATPTQAQDAGRALPREDTGILSPPIGEEVNMAPAPTSSFMAELQCVRLRPALARPRISARQNRSFVGQLYLRALHERGTSSLFARAYLNGVRASGASYHFDDTLPEPCAGISPRSLVPPAPAQLRCSFSQEVFEMAIVEHPDHRLFKGACRNLAL